MPKTHPKSCSTGKCRHYPPAGQQEPRSCTTGVPAQQLSVKDKNMDRSKEDHTNGYTAVGDQHRRVLIQNHAQKSCDEGKYRKRQQQPGLPAQLLAVDNAVERGK